MLLLFVKCRTFQRGECRGCETYLEPIIVAKQDFDKLRDSFIKFVIEGTDVFLHTNPAEVKRYREFVERTAPFDIVIDGLNVAYFQNQTKQTGASLARQVLLMFDWKLVKPRFAINSLSVS